MTTQQILLTVIIIAATTFATRFLPFLIFPEGRKIPETVDYLERVLPFAMIGMLIVYCFKDIRPFAPPYGLPEGIASAVLVLIDKLTRKMILTIGGGLIVHMILVQLVFTS